MIGAPELLLARRCCDECLTGRGRIVPGARAAQIVRDCRRAGLHFQCHKGTIAGQNIHCRGVHEILVRLDGGSAAYRMALAIGVSVREIDPEGL